MRRDLLIAPRAAWVPLLLLGVFGVGAFYVALTKAVELAGVSLAAVILYIAPALVTVIGALFLGEPFTRRKALALVFSLTGCALAVKIYDIGFVRVSLWGIAASLATAAGYAIFATFTNAPKILGPSGAVSCPRPSRASSPQKLFSMGAPERGRFRCSPSSGSPRAERSKNIMGLR